MKAKVLLFTLALATISSFAIAQQGPNRQGGNGGQNRMSAEARVEHMTKELALTDAEKSKVLELFKREEAKAAAMWEEIKKQRENGQQLGEEQRSKMQELRKANDLELEKIIGKEKFTKWQSIRSEQMKQMRERRGQNRQGRPDAPGMHMNKEKAKEMMSAEKRAERLKQQLSLSDEQKVALEQLFTEQEQKMAEEKAQKIKGFKAENDAAIEKIIGKEKMEQYKKIRDEKVDKAKRMRAGKAK